MRVRCLMVSFGLALLPSLVHAQALPAATRSGIVQAGVTYTSVSPDYTEKRISGMSAYATFDFTRHLGVEAAYHNANIITPEDLGETSYEIGLRYVYRKGRYEPYVRGMIGRASLIIDGNSFVPSTSQGYGEYSLGGGLDIRLGHHINLRAIDFELQTWPTFSPNNLSPMLISVGAAYRLR